MSDPAFDARIREAYARAEQEDVRVVRLKDLISEANALGKDDAELRSFAEIVVRKAADLRQIADMLASDILL